MRTHITLRIICDTERLWDTIEIQAWNADDVLNWYKRDVFSGQSHEIALQKALTELEALAIKLRWLEPGSLGGIELGR